MQYVLTLVCICLCVGHDRKPCKMAEPIEMPYRGRLGPRNRVLDGNAYRRHLDNTIERSVFDKVMWALVSIVIATSVSFDAFVKDESPRNSSR